MDLQLVLKKSEMEAALGDHFANFLLSLSKSIEGLLTKALRADNKSASVEAYATF